MEGGHVCFTHKVEVEILGLEILQTPVKSLLNIFWLVICIPQLSSNLAKKSVTILWLELSHRMILTKISLRGTPEALIPSPTSLSLPYTAAASIWR